MDGRPIVGMVVIDPHREPTHDWEEIEADLRAIDIWIGSADALHRGLRTAMMHQAIDRCFVVPEVAAIVIDPLASNVAGHRFYRRHGFREEGRRRFSG